MFRHHIPEEHLGIFRRICGDGQEQQEVRRFARIHLVWERVSFSLFIESLSWVSRKLWQFNSHRIFSILSPSV